MPLFALAPDCVELNDAVLLHVQHCLHIREREDGGADVRVRWKKSVAGSTTLLPSALSRLA